MAIGPFGVHTTQRDGVRIRYYAQPGSERTSPRVLGWARRAVHAFTTWYGRDTLRTLDIAGARFARDDSAMEYPGLVMTNPVRDTVFHEVAHQWFYAMVGNDQYAQPWLDESFTEFSNRRLQGLSCDTAHPWRGIPRRVRLRDGVRALTRAHAYIATVYDAGPCVLERLRRDWGSRRFDGMASFLVSRFRNRIETTADVIAAWRRYAPRGFDVGGFLRYARLAG